MPVPVAARWLDEQAGHLEDLAAVELTCAAQGVDVGGRTAALGAGTRALHALVREHVPFLRAGAAPVVDLGPLAAALRAHASAG